VTSIRQEDWLRDASLLARFYEKVNEERKRRLTANVSLGERELVDSPDLVQRSQEDIAKKKAQLDSIVIQREGHLKEVFPELQR
jgi:hypothetical protein